MKTKLEMELEITQEIIGAIVEKMIASGDYVPVVRCKDCRHYETCRTTNVWAVKPDENWFCADGERKE